MGITFDPYNFDYKAYMLETYNLTEMPNKYYREEFRCDDVFLNSQDAIWAEKQGKYIDDYKQGSLIYRLFIHKEEDITTYYLIDKNKPFIYMEYSFRKITSPLKGIENKHIWNFKWDKGLARMFFDDYIIPREPVIISDSLQTEKGFGFWKYLFMEYVRDSKTHKMYVIDINDGKMLSVIENINQMDTFYTDSKSGNLRFVLEKI